MSAPDAGQPASTTRADRLSPVVLILLAVAVVALTWRWAAGVGLLHLALYVASLLPGLPLGLRVFGRRHAAGWIAGAILGYAMTSTALWLVLSNAGGVTPLGGWTLAMAIGVALGFWPGARVALPRWTRPDTLALALVVLAVPLLVATPFSRLGELDDERHRRYRSYFTADFLWHMGLTSELAHLRLPARDPFAAPTTLHYYVAYFLVPAASVAHVPDGRDHISGILRVNALGAGMLLIAAVYLTGWMAVPRAAAMGWATVLALVGASAEGAYACIRLLTSGQPLDRLRTLNVDAITAWWFQAPTIDGLPRTLWYTPQHGASCALGLVALQVAAASGVGAPAAATVLAGLALALAIVFSPFLGGLFAVAFGVAIAVDALRTRRAIGLVQQAATIVPVAVAIWAMDRAQVLEGAGAALAVNLLPLVSAKSLTVIGLALGPLALVALAGVVADGRRPALGPALVAAVIGVVVFFTVSLAGTDPVWVGWRAGNLLLVMLPALAAAALARLSDVERPAIRLAMTTVVATLLLTGAVTTAADWFNAQDVENQAPGPGFKWTLTLTPAQQAAFRWIRTNTPPRAIVQKDPVVRGRDGWTNVPAFGQRVMAAGLPISLVLQPYHRERSNRVHDIYTTLDADAAWREARALRIDFLYLDAADYAALPEGAVSKFETAPALFKTSFAQDDVRVFAVER